MRNMNGVILAAQGVPSDNIGRQVKPQNYLDALSRSASGYYWGRSASDDGRRLMAYRTTEKFPLVFAVGLAESDGLGEYERIRTKYVVAAVILRAGGMEWGLRGNFSLAAGLFDDWNAR